MMDVSHEWDDEPMTRKGRRFAYHIDALSDFLAKITHHFSSFLTRLANSSH